MSQHGQFSHNHHHPHSHPAVLHNASLAEIASQPPSHYSSNLGSAVASSMHLTNSTSETDAGNATYKMEHDLMYYSVRFNFTLLLCRRFNNLFSSFSEQQTNPNELNHTNDGFLNSLLNDEDIQLMDMAVNEGEFKWMFYKCESLISYQSHSMKKREVMTKCFHIKNLRNYHRKKQKIRSCDFILSCKIIYRLGVCWICAEFVRPRNESRKFFIDFAGTKVMKLRL